MRPLRFVWLIVLAALVSAAGRVQESLAIRSANVVDTETGEVRTGQTVLVVRDRIEAVGLDAEVDVPAGAAVLDAEGRYLIPGLWDMHVHSVSNRGWHFPLLLAHGVTGVRNMHTSEEDPLGVVDSIRQGLAAGTLVGPRFVANGPAVDGPPGSFPGMVLAGSPAQARAVVDSLAAGGAEFVKVYDNLSRESFDALMAQARRRGIPVDGHVPFAVPAEAAARAGMRTVEHTSGITMGCSAKADSIRTAHAEMIRQPPLPFPDDLIAFFGLIRAASDSQSVERCASVAAAYRSYGVAATPTLVGTQSAMEDEAAARLLPPAVAEQWRKMAGPGPGERIAEVMHPISEATPKRVRILHDAGVTLLAGTDIGNPFLVPGHSLHQELALLVEVGLTPLEALQAATLNPARVLGMGDALGTVESGKLADLVLLDANPLDDIANTQRVRAVVADGRLFDRAALDRLLTRAESAGPTE